MVETRFRQSISLESDSLSELPLGGPNRDVPLRAAALLVLLAVSGLLLLELLFLLLLLL